MKELKLVIHDILIKSSSELISEDTPNYQYVAGRLLNYSIRKEAYGQYEPIPYGEYVNNMVQKVYTILSFWKNIIQQKSKNSGNALNTNVMINLLLLQ